jgi:O-antigen/teichoic acid export membrane protein
VTEAVGVSVPRGLRAPGTTTMVVGGLAGAVLAYAFQAVGTRALGDEGFAPIAAIWTAFFIIASVLFVPLEQYVTRETSRGRAMADDRRVILSVGILSVVAGVAYVLAGLDTPLFDGDSAYLAIIALLAVGYTILFTAKGVLAGNRRFADVGWVLGLEGVFRLTAGVALLAVVVDASVFAWAMVVAPVSALLLRFWRHDRAEPDVVPVGAGRFLGAYIAGSSASQLLLAGAPLGVAALGGSTALFSVVFVTFTLYRAPLTLIYSLQSRILPFLVSMAGEGDDQGLRRIALRIVSAGVVLTVLGGMVGWLVGPAVVGLMFSEGFMPARALAMLAAGGVMAGATAQVGGQVLVARARTAALAAAWVVGLLVALAVMVLVAGTPDFRVAVGFAAGEVTALAAVAFLVTRS